jgi:hypothetical protein
VSFQTKKDITINHPAKSLIRTLKKELAIVLNKEMNRSAYQVLYPACPTGNNRI